ncbi:MAG: hypothetical protein JW909_06285, partial [Planctomycetes bacterium]|nr:hypothetical protein [Planctomycetota bacterium]
VAMGRLYVYDGGAWLPMVACHADLAGIGENDHHDRSHPIDGGEDHSGVTGAVQDNFAAFDSGGLPKDSGKSAASFADASHDHDDRYYTESETDSLLAGKADKVGSTDLEITDSASGLVLRSPDGHRWRFTVDNSGQLDSSDLGT